MAEESDDIEKRLSTVDSTTFDEDDWNIVVKECSSLSAKWEEISSHLGLSPNTIATIKSDNPDSAQRCWNQALLEWIRQAYNTSKFGEPSWKTLLQAIAEENKLVFKKLSKKYQSPTPLAPSASKEPTAEYQFLNVKGMSKDEIAVLKVKLTKDYEDITDRYNTLTLEISSSLSDRGITPKELSFKLMNLNTFSRRNANFPLLQDKLDEIRQQETIEDAFFLLRSYSSFFDCYILRHIVKHLGTKSDKEKLAQYERELRKYCQRSIFECPRFSSRGSHHANLVMKVDEIVLESYSLNALDSFRVSLAKVLSLENHTLLLHTVEKGCVQLTFQVPHFAVETIFTLTVEQRVSLKSLGVMILSCGYHSVDLSTSPQPKPSKKLAPAASSDIEEKHQHHKARKRTISHSPLSQTDECGWFKLLGECRYGDSCQFQHTDMSPDTVCDFILLPRGKVELNKPCLSPNKKFYIVMQEDDITIPSGNMSQGERDTTVETGDSRVAACINSELKCSGGADITEASGACAPSLHQQHTGVTSEKALSYKVCVNTPLF